MEMRASSTKPSTILRCCAVNSSGLLGDQAVAVEIHGGAPARPGGVEPQRDDAQQHVHDPDPEVLAAAAGEFQRIRLNVLRHENRRLFCSAALGVVVHSLPPFCGRSLAADQEGFA